MESDEAIQQIDETPLKPKRTRKVSEEQKIILAERMRKVNEDRISKAKVANEVILDVKEKQMKEKLEKIAIKKEKTKEAVSKEAKKVEATVSSVEPPPVKEKKVRKVYVEESESEEEIVYVTKPKAKPKAPVAQPKAQVAQEPKVVFKFI